MLTRLEWFNTIEDEDVRHRAIGNTQDQSEYHGWGPGEDRLLELCESLNDAFMSGFIWSNTPEGITFWQKQCLSLTGVI